MIMPWNTRPDYHPNDTEWQPDEEVLDWEDNWLSNSIAWVSIVTGLESRSSDAKHWMNKVANYLWAECPTCLFFRGVLVGAVFVAILAAMLYFVV